MRVIRGTSQRLGDRIVGTLARISLIGVLALMGALFVGSAAVGGTSSGADDSSSANGDVAQASLAGVLEGANPTGLVLGAVVIGGGLLVLTVGAFRPPSRRERRELAELRRR